MSDNQYPNYPPPGSAPVQGGAPPAQGGGYPPQQAPQGYPPQQTQQGYPPEAAVAAGVLAGAGYPPPPHQQGYPVQAGAVQLPAGLMDEMAQDASFGGSSRDEVVYWRPKKPSTVGETTESVIRILPSWVPNQSRFWHRTSRHFLWLMSRDGKRGRWPRTCARETSPPAPCAICDRRDRAEKAGDDKTTYSLTPRTRYYFNVFDPEQTQEHWVQDQATGQSMARAFVWDCGPTIFRRIQAIMKERGPIYDLDAGRCIKILATKTGPEDREIRYDAIDRDPEPIPPEFRNIQLIDLSGLDDRRPYDEIAASIAQTYPDPQGMPVGQPQQAPQGYPPQQAPQGYPPQQAPQGYPPQQAPQGYPPQQGQPQPPYGNPYQGQPQGGPQQPQGGPPQQGQPPAQQGAPHQGGQGGYPPPTPTPGGDDIPF